MKKKDIIAFGIIGTLSLLTCIFISKAISNPNDSKKTVLVKEAVVTVALFCGVQAVSTFLPKSKKDKKQ